MITRSCSENGAARVLLTQDILEKYKVTDAETAAIVGAPGRIDTVKAWAILLNKLMATSVCECAVKSPLSMR